MVEAVVGVALRAILASVVLGGVLAALVLLATRALALSATTRHALWTTALMATALMPLAGMGVSMWKGAIPQTVVSREAAARPARDMAVVSHRTAVDAPAQHRTALGSVRHDIAAVTPPRERAIADRATAATAPSLVDRFAPLGGAAATWQPRLRPTLAVGVVGAWALGAGIGLFGLAASIVRVRGLKRRSSPLDGTLADELPWLTEIGPGREIYLRLSFETETPVAIGFRRPVILIPTELATADGLTAIESLILHEHAHLRRYDDWTNLVQRIVERIFWFNPIVWFLGRRIALEREIASDDAVVEKTGEPHAYATSLWRLAREMRMPEHAVVAPGALLTRKQITVRIEQLLDKKRARLHRSPAAALGVALAGVLAVAFVATSAPAVELPVAAEKPLATATAAPSSWSETTVTTTTESAPPKLVSPAKPAAHARANAHPALSATRQAPPETRRYEIVAQATPATVVRERIVYVHDTPAPRVSLDMPMPAAPVGETSSTAPFAHMPTMAPMPRVPSMTSFPHVPAIPPRALAAVRAASGAAAAQAVAAAQDATRNMGPEVTRALHEAMTALPRQIAQESNSPRRHARLAGVKLSRELIASCVGCSFRNTDVRGVDLHNLTISANDFTGADMRGVNLAGAKLVGVSLVRANLANADLRGAQMSGVELEHANFDGALLDNIKLVGVSIQHVSLRGTSLRPLIANCTGCDFSHLDLHGQDLHGIALSGADLSRADLHDANLSGVRFSGVDLSNANLAGADLTNAHLDGCDLSGVDLRGARTAGMTMHGSGLDG